MRPHRVVTLSMLTVLALAMVVPSSIHALQTSSIKGFFDVGGRKLYLSCEGTGSPTIVIEPGQGVSRSVWTSIGTRFSSATRVCTYDRANRGQSDAAPTPRTATAIVRDLERLLQVARVPSPYLLVGHSAGGELVRLFSSRNPTLTTGFLAINSVPVASAWLPRALPLFTPAQRREELAFYAGDNQESIAWRAGTKALSSARPPRGKPFTIMISTIAQCAEDSPGGPCYRSYALYTKLQRELATKAPRGRFVMLAGQHELYLDHPQVVIREIQRLLSLAR